VQQQPRRGSAGPDAVERFVKHALVINLHGAPPLVIFESRKPFGLGSKGFRQKPYAARSARYFCQKYFLIPSVASAASALMVMVNLMPLRSENLSHQSAKSSVFASRGWPIIFRRLSIKIWVTS
jgi:hypothetical protein